MPTIRVSNAATGKISSLAHHCSECKKPMTQRCLEKQHIAYCEKCRTLFNVKTRGGCARAGHSYADGVNLGVVNSRRGFDSDFKSSWQLEQEMKACAQKEAAEAAQAEALENRPYDTDWNRPQFRTKGTPKESTKSKAKKQQPALSYNEMKRAGYRR